MRFSKKYSEDYNTASNIELGAVNMKYSPEIEQERNHLINSLNWNIVGDALGTCTLPDDPIAIQELNEEHLNLYPNPVRSTLTINYADHINIQSIHIYNITGQKVMEVEALNQTTLEVNHLKSGIYFVEIRDDQANKIVKKLIKF